MNVTIAVFIAGVLFTSGLEVTFEQVLTPLKDRPVVARALLANIVIVPLFVYAMSIVYPLERPYMIGVLLYGFASGAPYTPKLVSAAAGNVPSSIASTAYSAPFSRASMTRSATCSWMYPTIGSGARRNSC